MVGDALANLLAKAGFAVTKEYYINDSGAQVTALAWAAYWRYLQAIGTQLSGEQFIVRFLAACNIAGITSFRLAKNLPRSRPRARRPGGEVAAPHVWLDIVRDFTVARMMRGNPRGPGAARRRPGRVHLGTFPGR